MYNYSKSQKGFISTSSDCYSRDHMGNKDVLLFTDTILLQLLVDENLIKGYIIIKLYSFDNILLASDKKLNE